MTLPRTPFFVGGGAQHDATQVRLSVLGNGAEGIIGRESLMVRALSTPGSQVRIGDGAFRVKGRVNPWQGSYSAYNIGDELVDVPANNTATTRYDLLVIRVEDPQYEGTRNPLVDDIIFPELITNVGSTVKTLAGAGKAGYSAIPVARLEIPANTAAITGAMINTSVRFLAEPQRDRQPYLAYSTGGPSASLIDPLDFTTFTRWPDVAAWNIDVPDWAIYAIVRADIAGPVLKLGYSNGLIRVVLGEGGAGPEVSFDLNWTGSPDRKPFTYVGRLDIPAAARGTKQTLGVQGRRTTGAGRLGADVYTTTMVDIEFFEGVY